jgi:hypothetical protein
MPRRSETTPGKFDVSVPGEHVGALNGQGGGDVAVTGVDSDEPAAADPEHQGIDVEHDGQAELEGGHLLTVHQDADGGPLLQRDLVRGHVVVASPGWGSRRTVWVGSCPVSGTPTTSGREVSGTARTSVAASACWSERAERARSLTRPQRRAISVQATATTAAATAASKATSCFGSPPEGRFTMGALVSLVGVAGTPAENGLSCPAALTAVTVNQYFVPFLRLATMASVPLVVPSAALFCTPGAVAK